MDKDQQAQPLTAKQILDRKLLLRVEEVAEILSESPRNVYELIRDGFLVAHCRNGAATKPVRITSASVKRYCTAHLVNGDDWKI